MGQSRIRVGRTGVVRWTAYYLDATGQRRSAGTYPTQKLADKAWHRAESRVADGRHSDPQRGRLQFRRYVEEVWFPAHQIEFTTRQNYRLYLDRHILPTFGGYRINAIQPADIRTWVTRAQTAGVKPSTIKYCLSILSAIFTTALNDQIISLHPVRGVKPPTVPVKTRQIITPDQFDRIHRALPSPVFRLLVETDIETGLRWGELVELRTHDINWDSGVLTVARVAVELSPKFHPDGQRFLIKQYPKDDEWRRITLSRHIHGLLTTHANNLRSGDLLFPAPPPEHHTRSRPPVLPDPATLGLTGPTPTGRQYPHGTINAYSTAGCRCQHCRNAYAHYRATRRTTGHDHPRTPRTPDTDGHLPRRWFRDHIWQPALTTAALPTTIRFHDLRHAHASWLLAGGADLQTVKERMGHARLTTTEKYLHTLPHADHAATTALNTIRKHTT